MNRKEFIKKTSKVIKIGYKLELLAFVVLIINVFAIALQVKFSNMFFVIIHSVITGYFLDEFLLVRRKNKNTEQLIKHGLEHGYE